MSGIHINGSARKVVGAAHARAAKTNGAAHHKVKPTVVDDPVVTELFAVPSGRRLIVSALLGVITYATTWYVGLQLTGALVAAAALLTTSQFLIYMVTFIAMFTAFVAAWWLGSKVFDLAAEFDISKLTARVTSYRERFAAWRAERQARDEAQAHYDMEDVLRGGL